MSKILTPKEYKKMYKEIQKHSKDMIWEIPADEFHQEFPDARKIDTRHTGIQEFALKYPEWYSQNKGCIYIKNSHISLVIPNYKRLKFKLEDEKRDSEDISYYTHEEALALENDTYRLPTNEDHKTLVKWIEDETMGSDFLQMVLGYGLNGYKNGKEKWRVSTYGYYWQLSPPSDIYASHMFFDLNAVHPAGIAFRSLGFSVRCLLK
jgi:hypothetical protein